MFRGSYFEHPNNVICISKLINVILLKIMPLPCFDGFVVYGKYPVYCDTNAKYRGRRCTGWLGDVIHELCR